MNVSTQIYFQMRFQNDFSLKNQNFESQKLDQRLMKEGGERIYNLTFINHHLQLI